MIKPIQLLKESFTTYKANIKNIILMTSPMILLTIVGQYYSFIVEGMKGVDVKTTPIFFIATLISFLSFILITLFFEPAFTRSLQKNEDNNNFDVKDGYGFQKKNIWNYIVLFFWTIVYSIKVNIKYLLIIIVAGVLFSIMTIFFNQNLTYLLIAGVVFGVIVLITIIFAIIKNLTKFIFPKNVFFSKGIKPREAVKEAMELGKNNNKDVWKVVLTSVIFAIITIIIYSILSLLFSLIYRFTSENIGMWAEMIISALIAFILVSPISLIILVKGYNKIRGEVVTE